MPKEAQFAPPNDDPLRKATPAVDDVEARRARAAIEGRLFSGPAPRVKVGRYRVLGKIGAGGMGVVYKAHDPDLARDVAVKLMNNDAVGDADTERARGRLVREARAMARLAHPNVIHVYDVGMVEDGVFIAMELVDGESLGAWMRAAPRPWKETLQMFIDAGRGLAAAHEAGVIHRDFKPENVLVGADGRVRVGDFGLAGGPGSETGRHSPAESGESLDRRAVGEALTRTGALLGTPKYMAPEQETGLAATARSDQFSFCVALYEGLYGEAPFAGETVIEYRRAVKDGEIRSVPPPDGLPAWVGNVLTRGLSPHPAERHTSMGGLLDKLEEALADPVQKVVGRKRRRFGWAMVGGAVLAGAVVVGMWLGRPAEQPRSTEVVIAPPQEKKEAPEQKVEPAKQPEPTPEPAPEPETKQDPVPDPEPARAVTAPEKKPAKEPKSRKKPGKRCYFRQDRPLFINNPKRDCMSNCVPSTDSRLVAKKGIVCKSKLRCKIDDACMSSAG